MATIKSSGYLFMLLVLTAFLIVFLSIMSEILDKNNYGMQRSWQKMRRVDKHFFFDLLPSFDLPLLNRDEYQPSQFIKQSQFSDIIDRVLLSRYLVDRFAYTSFIQFGCRSSQARSIYQLLPDTTMKTRICVDRREGTIRTSPTVYLNSSYAQNRRFDLIVADAESLSNNLLDSYLTMLNEGGAVVVTGSNMFKLESNKTTSVSGDKAEFLQQMIFVRGRYDLDLATLDADEGLSVIYNRRNSAHLDVLGLDTALKELEPYSTLKGDMSEGVPKGDRMREEVHLNQELAHRVLNLMRFEDLHDWLAPTGHVDAVTAFGGDKAFQAFREAEQSNRMVEAVTALGELMSLNPMWYKWMLSQLSSQIAQTVVSSSSAHPRDNLLDPPSFPNQRGGDRGAEIALGGGASSSGGVSQPGTVVGVGSNMFEVAKGVERAGGSVVVGGGVKEEGQGQVQDQFLSLSLANSSSSGIVPAYLRGDGQGRGRTGTRRGNRRRKGNPAIGAVQGGAGSEEGVTSSSVAATRR